ncbi:PREDICTED: gamma-butyrobetaine dioxygenase-like [Priapulus caudatus]|uniref:Gamma-butyrobetaine dioxygenase-like n=1 Tax=Priapulus caudatus TaxID=37621 RepID=A0ABM1F4F9_PRICU|nr:PREDICTED: gamma-butyrobetaine dioxygenase-like [Priapulus caudatus]
MMTSDDGLFRWLDYIHKYGLAFLRGVPLNKDEIIKVVQRFAYVKQTSYGITFDVVNEPDPEAHLAFTGVHLDHHTDMNYREKSPGLQLLHCMKADVLSGEELENVGGESFFVDGFAIANWLRETHPAAFHVLTSTAVKFSIVNKGHRYSQKVPIICVDKAGDIEEVHVNNRTMGPLQVPSHLVLPFYHAYKILTNKIRDGSHELRFHMQPKDLVLFNNRRALHGRTQFDPSKISRHLIGCYTDSDEMMSKYDSFLIGSH